MLQTEGSVHSLSSDRFRLALSDVHGLGVTGEYKYILLQVIVQYVSYINSQLSCRRRVACGL